jgi:RHS repeat-associated protein
MKLLSPLPHLLLAGAFACCVLLLPEPSHAYYHHTDVRDAPARQLLLLAAHNPVCSSTKQDEETDLLYYGYRYYNASTGRWLSRDPIEEAGGLNLLCFVFNDAINALDPNGLRIRTGFPKRCGDIDDLKHLGEALDSLRRDFKNWRKNGYGEKYSAARQDACNGLRSFLKLLEVCCGPWRPQQAQYFELLQRISTTWCSDPPSSTRELERDVKQTVNELGVEMSFQDWLVDNYRPIFTIPDWQLDPSKLPPVPLVIPIITSTGLRAT